MGKRALEYFLQYSTKIQYNFIVNLCLLLKDFIKIFSGEMFLMIYLVLMKMDGSAGCQAEITGFINTKFVQLILY